MDGPMMQGKLISFVDDFGCLRHDHTPSLESWLFAPPKRVKEKTENCVREARGVPSQVGVISFFRDFL